MSELVFDKHIDLLPHAVDRYGRTVAQVISAGKDVGEEMLRQGMAWIYDRYIATSQGIRRNSEDLSEISGRSQSGQTGFVE